MTFEVDVGGRTFTIAVERTDRPHRFRIVLDGASRLIDASRTGDFGLSLLDVGTAAAVPLSADVQIVPGPGPGDLLVGLRGRTIGVTVNGRRSAHAEGAVHGHGEATILAPMPGRVVRVLVATGDQVDARQPVVVVEAMKMENELRAVRGGTVSEVHAHEGRSVDAGALLVTIQ